VKQEAGITGARDLARLARELLERSVGLDETLGVRYEKLEPGEVILSLEIDGRHLQPLGYVHGGVAMAMAESAASVGGVLNCEPGHVPFGMQVSANHVRPKRGVGTLTAAARPVHLGRTSQVWDVWVRDEEGRDISVARCTLAVVPQSGNVLPDSPVAQMPERERGEHGG
jgi:1,4-dihydroxy-2-naphthoyl-CoA hydrolase